MSLNQKIRKRGQVEITFNWVYILIAGAVILLFFVGIVFKQKAISEEHLSTDVVRIMESIFTAAQSSEKTKSSIPVGGLSDKTFYFHCEDGVGEYGLEGLSVRVQNSLYPLFAPSSVKSSRLILWSLPYILPFKITDFLMVTSINHYYYFLGEGQGFSDEFIRGAIDLKDPSVSIKAEKVLLIEEITLKNSPAQVRIIDAEGFLTDGARIPANLQTIKDEDLTAVSFIGQSLNFFRKQGSVWSRLNSQPISIVSAADERAAKYAAVFTEDPDIYLCNMQKAYRRIKLIAEIYGSKLDELKTYYQSAGESGSCLGFIDGFTEAEGNIKDTLTIYKNKAAACALLADNSCLEVVDSAEQLRALNENLAEECSITFY